MEKELSNMDIVLFALYKRGGISQKVHTEEIAWEAYQLAKERFSWRLPKFRKMSLPDKTPVRFVLEQAKKKDHGRLVAGRAGGDVSGSELEGWRFTPEGVTWIKENETRISQGLKQKAPDIPKHEAERFLKKIKTDPFFKYFQEKRNLDDASQYMFTDMLVCSPDASKNVIKQKFESLYSKAELVNDVEILCFLKTCSEKFSHLIT